MAKLIGGVPKTQYDAQERANEQASHLLGWQAKQIRDQKGADRANADHVARREKNAARPTHNLRMISPLFTGKKTVDTVEGQLNMGKGKK